MFEIGSRSVILGLHLATYETWSFQRKIKPPFKVEMHGIPSSKVLTVKHFLHDRFLLFQMVRLQDCQNFRVLKILKIGHTYKIIDNRMENSIIGRQIVHNLR